MINIIEAKYVKSYEIKLKFSDNTFGILDFSYLQDIQTILTNPLKEKEYFKSFFIDFGALCWKNGLEFSAESLQRKLISNNSLKQRENAA